MASMKHDFLKEDIVRQHGGRGIFWAVVVILAVVAISFTTIVWPVAVVGRSILADVQDGRADFVRAQSDVMRLDFQSAVADLASAQARFESVQAGLDRLGWIGDLPRVRDEVASARSLAVGAVDTAIGLRGALSILEGASSVVGTAAQSVFVDDNRQVSELTRDDRRAILAQLASAPATLAESSASLDRAIENLNAAKRTALTAGVLDALEPSKQKLIELRGYLNQDLGFLAKIPALVGYPEPKTYLFLLLNNTELRPGGGFIGVYGVVKVADGNIESFFTDDVYAIDGPSEAWLKETPPAPIARYLNKRWFMRDANWSPDFVVSAAEVERFYHLERGPASKFDGVIGITPDLVGKLLAITGPIEIDGHQFNASNVTEELEYQVEKGYIQGGVSHFDRKDIVGKLGSELVKRLLRTPVSKLPDLAAVAQAAVAEKHLMTSFADPSLMAFADAKGWTGRVPAVSGDSLLVVDSNMGALKTDAVMERSVYYSFRPDGDGYAARAVITYKNNGRFDWKTTRYRTYTRFYVPLGSTLIKGEGMTKDDKLNDPRRTPGAIDVSADLGRTVFGGFISVEPGETKTLTVEYRLPESVVRSIKAGEYRLDVTKQLGTAGHRLTLDLDFDKKLAAAKPSEAPLDIGDKRYHLVTDLRVNREFSVTLAK